MNKLNLQTKLLSDLVSGLGVYAQDIEITQLCDDTRKLKAGDTFICLPRVKNIEAITKQAVSKGANAIIFVGKPKKQEDIICACVPDIKAAGKMLRRWFETENTHVHCVGITGTDGKTSTTWMLRQVMEKQLGTAWSVGTLGWIRAESDVEDLANTTPSLLRLHQILALATQQKVGGLILEVSSHGIEQERISGLPFSAAVWTTMGHDHLEDHGGYDAYLSLKEGFIKQVATLGGVVVANADYADISKVLKEVQGKIFWYAQQQAADVLWSVQNKKVVFKGNQEKIILEHVPIADFHAENLAAVALLMKEKFDVSLLQFAALAEAVSTPWGRLEAVDDQVFIDYAHTAEGLQRCLKSARQFTQGHLLLVFGCGGNRDKSKRPEMGEVAEKCADKVWLTSDNPRDEQQSEIAQEVLKGIKNIPSIHVVDDRALAIQQAVNDLLPQDVLVIAGKGHESYMEISGTRMPWSDKEIAKQALSEVKLCA